MPRFRTGTRSRGEMVTMKLEERTHLKGLDGEQGLRRERRPIALWPLLAVMGFLSIGGFVGGVSFVVDRTGSGLGAQLSWLDETPVTDFLLPGLFLLVLYAIGSAILIVGLTWRFSPGPLGRLDRWLGYHWSWAGTLLVGSVLVGWILYEFTIIPNVIVLQPILIVVGILMVAISMLPSMRRYYRTDG
jgi:hypothetical protein